MDFENLRIKDVSTVLHFDADLKRWDAKNRNFHIIGIKLSGDAFHELGYKSFTLSENCVYFFNKRDDYHVEVINPGEAFSIHFTTYDDISTDSFCIPIENPDELISLLKKAEIKSRISEDNDLSLLSVVYKICSFISNIRKRTYFPTDSRIAEAKRYIDMNFQSDDCLRLSVEKSGVGERRFNDLFKAHMGTTPNKYIIMKKISYAKNLLETGSVTVSEAAALSGFSDVYYFSKVFKEICGVPPSKWNK